MSQQPAASLSAGPAIAVSVDNSSHVAVVELRRGPRNYFDIDVLIELADSIEGLASGPARAIVLCSEGKHFCAGADFTGKSGALEREGAPHLYDVALRLFTQPLPIVAAVQGAAIGGGLGLALAADFRVATPGSQFAANFSLLGFHPGFGISLTLPLLVGRQSALDMLYTGRRVGGEEAQRIGLCEIVVPEDQLRDRAYAYAAEIAAAAPLAVRSIRETLRGHLAEDVKTMLERERGEQEWLMGTEDFTEGVAAVSERRQARFTGR